MSITVGITLGDQELDVVCLYTPSIAGRFDGPPEDCYESEPSYMEVENISQDGVSLNWLFHVPEANKLVSKICDLAEKECEGYSSC